MVLHIANTLGVADQFIFSPETSEAMVGPSNGVGSPKTLSGMTEDVEESGEQGVVDDDSNCA
jgi:hypothetical protein